jgi:hypothetical protein
LKKKTRKQKVWLAGLSQALKNKKRKEKRKADILLPPGNDPSPACFLKKFPASMHRFPFGISSRLKEWV